MCAWIRLWSDHSHLEATFWSYYPQTKVTSDHTIPGQKWPLIIPSPDRSDLWSYYPQTEMTSDHTIVRWNQIPDPVILVWEDTVCVGLGLIRGHFRMAPQRGSATMNWNYENSILRDCTIWQKKQKAGGRISPQKMNLLKRFDWLTSRHRTRNLKYALKLRQVSKTGIFSSVPVLLTGERPLLLLHGASFYYFLALAILE